MSVIESCTNEAHGSRCRASSPFQRATGTLLASWLALVLSLAAGGCAMGSHTQAQGDAEPAASAVPQPPAVMEQLADALMRYRAARGGLPVDLDRLIEAELLPAEAREALADHAYAQGGLGRLPDGRRVLVVDAHVRAGERAWCIVDEAGPTEAAAQMELVLVPMDALRRAAGQGRG